MIKTINNTLKLIGNQGHKWTDLFLALLLLSSISAFLAVKSWTNTSIFILLAWSLCFIKISYLNIKQAHGFKLLAPILITLCLPVIAVFISQLGRQDWLFKSYDGPARMFFSIPILFLFIYKKIDFTQILSISSPIALWITSISIYSHPEITQKWGGRFATIFVDPNALGVYCAVLTSFCLFNLDASLKSSKLWFSYQLSGIILGFYLVLGSFTRGSWLAIPFVILLWLFFNYHKIKKPFIYIVCLPFLIFLLTIPYFYPQISTRFWNGLQDIFSWFDQTRIYSSPGLRLSIWKISWQLFLHNPFFGYGHTGFADSLSLPWFSSTASDAAKAMLTCCGVHNEFLANLVRSGIMGGISILGLFITPIVIFSKHARHHHPKIAKSSQLGLVYLICLGICSLSLEVFNLKYEATFYALIISGLIAQTVHTKNDI